MSHKSLKNHLNAIANDKPINLHTFKQNIQALNLSHRFEETDITAEQTKGKSYLITHIHPALKQELEKLVMHLSDEPNRINQATQNNSHSHNVDGSFLLVRHGISHPQVALINGQGIAKYPIQQNRQALIIENRELFIKIEQTQAFINEFCDLPSLANLDVIFSIGNEISNQLHHHFLNHYERIFLLLDIDLGGLLIAKNLTNLLPNMNLSFLYPHDLDKRLANVVQLQSNQTIGKIMQIATYYPQFADIARLVVLHKKTLEQESYLQPNPLLEKHHD